MPTTTNPPPAEPGLRSASRHSGPSSRTTRTSPCSSSTLPVSPAGSPRACAGLSLRLPGHSSTALWHGEIHQVAADPAYRRRGYARRVTRAARDWLAAQGCSSAALTATESGVGLCEELGFRPIPYQRMVWRPVLPRGTKRSG
ncbi:GNAT family N-acetyltransferase [Streptomyces gamaensis]|uniref:GNAT family N-acetyltransferase n=1 Tax=Streptomyces gamaensis TaxID=1763542 RepID=A0ABW0YWH7_9ACTN